MLNSKMGSPVQKKSSLLIYPGSSNLPMALSRNSLALFPIVKQQFWKIIDKLPLSASIPFESTDKEVHRQYLTLDNHLEGEGIFDKPLPLLRIRIGKQEVPWFKLRIESKTQTN